ncbi:TrbI F-type domain-containing protein [Photobacterium leiognathi]|uniref:TrbI F-type domain-containing protein n=1 Tax=Photobacterium leiognathi TaxID=553611 RepID=UPI002735F115|nr:TrbI F-type domain-containing protein [Photobacterium leiognathi]
MSMNSSLLTLFLFVFITVPIVLFINYLVTPSHRFAVFDLNGTIEIYTRDLTEQKLDKSTFVQKERQFKFILNKVLTDYSNQNKVIILMEPVVIKGAPNITIPLQKKISLEISRLQ